MQKTSRADYECYIPSRVSLSGVRKPFLGVIVPICACERDAIVIGKYLCFHPLLLFIIDAMPETSVATPAESCYDAVCGVRPVK